MSAKKYFTKEEIVEVLKTADEYNVSDFECLFESMIRSSDYILGTYEAVGALENFKNDEELDRYRTGLDGIFGAIELVKWYEIDQFREQYTALDDPQQVANMIEYIRSETLFCKALRGAQINIKSEANKSNIKKFIEAAKKL